MATSEISTLGAEKYVLLTTFTRDGRPKPTPVWIADLGDGSIGFTTASSSWKAKRIRNTPGVVLQPSDARGRVTEGTEPVTATAELREGAGFEAVRSAVARKYKLQYQAISFWGRLARLVGRGSGTDTAVVISPSN
jgi:PPOX class probable F420-dependent enzyme